MSFPTGAVTADNPWREAVIDALVVRFVYVPALHDNDPERALNDLIAWEVIVALDPAVSRGARALIQRGRDSLMRPDGSLAPA